MDGYRRCCRKDYRCRRKKNNLFHFIKLYF